MQVRIVKNLFYYILKHFQWLAFKFDQLWRKIESDDIQIRSKCACVFVLYINLSLGNFKTWILNMTNFASCCQTWNTNWEWAGRSRCFEAPQAFSEFEYILLVVKFRNGGLISNICSSTMRNLKKALIKIFHNTFFVCILS